MEVIQDIPHLYKSRVAGNFSLSVLPQIYSKQETTRKKDTKPEYHNISRFPVIWDIHKSFSGFVCWLDVMGLQNQPSSIADTGNI